MSVVFFARSFCTDELERGGLPATIVQCSISFNASRGTMRGMHFQVSPHEEEKYVRCTSGAIYDVIVDVRPQSSTFRRWFGVELSAQNHLTLFVPKGFAHGFLTLQDESEVLYMMTQSYVPGFGRTLRWNDPAIDIAWPFASTVMAERDATAPTLAALELP